MCIRDRQQTEERMSGPAPTRPAEGPLTSTAHDAAAAVAAAASRAPADGGGAAVGGAAAGYGLRYGPIKIDVAYSVDGVKKVHVGLAADSLE